MTVAEITLPVSPAGPAGEGWTVGATAPRDVPDPGPAAEPRPRIMLADDDRGFREMLRDLLTDEGFEVVGEAADGAEAVALAPRVRPDIVFMDLRMPEVDGIEATRRVKAALPLAQVIILSAYDDPGLQRGASEAGVYCYLIKGCPPQMIREMLEFAWTYKLGLQGNGVGWAPTAPPDHREGSALSGSQGQP